MLAAGQASLKKTLKTCSHQFHIQLSLKRVIVVFTGFLQNIRKMVLLSLIPLVTLVTLHQ